MDFSVFDRKKQLNEKCEIIVVDFVNKKTLYKQVINNLRPLLQAELKDLYLAIEQTYKIRDEFIKNQELAENLEKKGA